MEECEPDVDVHDLPDDCLETAENPGELYRKLEEWLLPRVPLLAAQRHRGRGVAWTSPIGGTQRAGTENA